MRRVSSVVAAGVATVVLAGWQSASPHVRHASVSLPGPGNAVIVVDVWRDPSDGETAFRLHGDSEVEVLRGRSLALVSEGRLEEVTVYPTVAKAWKIVHARFGLTAMRTARALAAGDTVDRPALMTLPKADTSSGGYTFTRDFGTDVAQLRRAARFAVPSPGRRLGGVAIADAYLSRWLSGDPGYLAVIQYSSDPAHLGSGDSGILLNVATLNTPYGSSYSTFYAKSRDRITGAGYEARWTSDGDLILRYHSSYVLVRIDGSQADGRVRSILQRIARS